MELQKPTYRELEERILQLESVLQNSQIAIPEHTKKTTNECATIPLHPKLKVVIDAISGNSFSIGNSHYTKILNLITDAVVLYDACGKRCFANASYYAIHGYEQDAIFDSPYSRNVHPDDVAAYNSIDLQLFDYQKTSTEYRFRHNLGYWVLLQKTIYYVPQDNGYYTVAVIKNQTEQKKNERVLRETNTFIEKIINTSPSITYIYDIDEQRNIFINNGLTKILGYSIEEVQDAGENFLSLLMHPDDIGRAREHQSRIANARDGEMLEIEYMFRHKNGDWRWLHSWESVFIRKKNGQVKQISGVLLDVTSQKRTEQALTQNERSLKRQNEELLEAKRKAEDADRLKSAFLANMSHEIRTPMNGIVGFAQLLAKEDISLEKRKYYTDIISKSGRQLLGIISDIMDISKIETGQVKIQPESTSINGLWNDLKALYRPLVLEKHLQLRFVDGLSDDEAIVLVDKTKFTQIVTNLINNALKFTSSGGIEVGYKLVEGELHFWVKDTGVGIPSDTIASVFDRFYQVESNTRHHSGGTGLGLSICKAFVELMNGDIWVESEVNKGSCFWFTLPWIPLVIPKVNDYSIQLNENIIATVIVAEDEDINYQYIEEIYQDTPVQLLRANSGKETIELLKKHPETSMILMDIRMPIMNGYDATIEIRKTNQYLPIVAVTAYALSEDRQRFLPAGFTDYIAKPYTKEQIDDVLYKYCKKQPA